MGLELLAGARFPVSDSIDLGLKYRFFNIEKLNMVSPGDDRFETDLSSHSVLASVLFNFGGAAAPPPPPPPPRAARRRPRRHRLLRRCGRALTEREYRCSGLSGPPAAAGPAARRERLSPGFGEKGGVVSHAALFLGRLSAG